jgi:hypothetical protein
MISRKRERGQAMVEFAIVLPILIVMTLGGIYLTLSYLHKLRMNGLAFMSARVAAVRADGYQAADFVKERYKRASQQNWVDQIESPAQAASPGKVSVVLQKQTERLDLLANAIDILSGGGSSDPTQLTAQATMPHEYWTWNGEARPRTRTIVDYRYGSVGPLPWIELLDALPDAIFDAKQMADTPPGGSGNDELLGLAPPNTNLINFYNARGWSRMDYLENTEKESGQFDRMRLVGTYFKAIENGASLTGYLLEFSGIGTALQAVLGNVTEVMSVTVENTMGKVSSTLDKQTRASMQTLPGDLAQ